MRSIAIAVAIYGGAGGHGGGAGVGVGVGGLRGMFRRRPLALHGIDAARLRHTVARTAQSSRIPSITHTAVRGVLEGE